jgi:DHA1 family bicyclomycin/chloramphenicol resistance-like MFS transporter
MLIVVSAACFSASIITPCLPFMAGYFNVSNDQTSLLLSVFLFGYLFGQILHSILSQFLGYKVTLMLGFFIYIGGCISQILAIKHHSLEMLYYCRFLCALGASSGLICVFAMIKEYSADKNEAQKLIALAFISLSLFAHLSITIGGIITYYWGWILVMYFALCVSILEFILIYKYIPNSDKIAKSRSISFKETIILNLHAFFNLRLIISSLIVTFATTSSYLYNAYASTISASIFHISSSTFGLISILNLSSLLTGGWIGSSLVKNYQASNVLLFGIFISLIPISSLFVIHDIVFASDDGALFFLLITVLNFGLGLIYPTASYLALSSIDSSVIASSTMNFLKISIPAFIIYTASIFHFELVTSYQYSLAFIFIIALLSSFLIKMRPS